MKILRVYACILFLSFCFLLPFGQLLRYETYLFSKYIVIHPVDVVVFLSLPYLLLSKKNSYFIHSNKLILVLIFSMIFSLNIFMVKDLMVGFLYLIRLISYFSFAHAVYYISTGDKEKEKIITFLYLSITSFLIIGFVQYIYYFDLRDLYNIGWDDHYFRFVSTLFDPAYTALVLIIGLIILLEFNLPISKYLKYIFTVLFIISILLTFSRAGYLTLIGYFLIKYKKYVLKILLISVAIILFILILPKPKSSGVEIYRTFSIYSRLDNYYETFNIFKIHPLFGIGFNNICLYRVGYLNVDNIKSHSCSGSDSSILLLLASSGILGLVTFINVIFNFIKNPITNSYNRMLFYLIFITLINSLFNNSLFYNYLMGLYAIILGLAGPTFIPQRKG
ncbi:MAG: hypothetical protein US97_C0029G0006 [Microgenomates group bacterium GW2011_GWF1_38_5]|nr:MAG: hypothetical protein US97_C0029G0006 [Microgenomates group bacterium GW2011_GWF1_38_5]